MPAIWLRPRSSRSKVRSVLLLNPHVHPTPTKWIIVCKTNCYPDSSVALSASHRRGKPSIQARRDLDSAGPRDRFKKRLQRLSPAVRDPGPLNTPRTALERVEQTHIRPTHHLCIEVFGCLREVDVERLNDLSLKATMRAQQRRWSTEVPAGGYVNEVAVPREGVDLTDNMEKLVAQTSVQRDEISRD